MLLGSRPKSHPLPELAALAPTSPSFAGRGGTSWPTSLAADRLALSTSSLLFLQRTARRSVPATFVGCRAKWRHQLVSQETSAFRNPTDTRPNALISLRSPCIGARHTTGNLSIVALLSPDFSVGLKNEWTEKSWVELISGQQSCWTKIVSFECILNFVAIAIARPDYRATC